MDVHDIPGSGLWKMTYDLPTLVYTLRGVEQRTDLTGERLLGQLRSSRGMLLIMMMVTRDFLRNKKHHTAIVLKRSVVKVRNCFQFLVTSFGSVGPKLWNSLPDDITSALSLPVFRKKLKTHLFQQSYPDIIL